MMIPANFLTGSQAIACLEAGERSLAEIIQEHRDRYDERNGMLGAWTTVRFDEAIRRADEQDAEEDVTKKQSALRGLMVGVKDLIGKPYPLQLSVKHPLTTRCIDTVDMPTERGAEMYRGRMAGENAPLVEILQQAGATIIGKTVGLFSFG